MGFCGSFRSCATLLKGLPASPKVEYVINTLTLQKTKGRKHENRKKQKQDYKT